MRYIALAVDYDGTIARHGAVDESTREALRRLASSGRKLILVTGRQLEDLENVFDDLELFDRIVAENGAVLMRPAAKEVVPLAQAPPKAFVDRLQADGVAPLSVGRVIVATWEPNEDAVLAAIRDLGLELHVVFNKGAVMVLPSGTNKAAGLAAALEELGISAHNVVGVGDAENDHAFLSMCELSVAVANALPALAEQADLVTSATHGAGVAEVVQALLDGERLPSPERHMISVGDAGESPVLVDPQRDVVLAAGPSGSGKSTLAMALLERLGEAGYQYCVVDPEGDYAYLEDAVRLGDADRAPTVDEVAGALAKPGSNVVAGLLGLPLEDRPGFADALLPRLTELRVKSSRPHWVLIDEGHHMLHRGREAASPPDGGALLVTVHPERLAPEVLARVTVVVATGDDAWATITAFAEAARIAPPASVADDGRPVFWRRGSEPMRFRIAASRSERRRHVRKYAQGELGRDKSFTFTGPAGRLSLVAQNLDMFLRMAEGVDDETWRHHLSRGDVEAWFRHAIKDDALADEAAEIARAAGDDDDLGRGRIAEAVRRRYTAPE